MNIDIIRKWMVRIVIVACILLMIFAAESSWRWAGLFVLILITVLNLIITWEVQKQMWFTQFELLEVQLKEAMHQWKNRKQ